jgi:uncharacterized protein YwqG
MLFRWRAYTKRLIEIMISREELRNLIRDAGLPHRADDFMNATKPAIHIRRHRVADESALELGSSKLGGAPDMPSGFVWPHWNDKPLTFIAQIRLAEVASYDVEKALPPGGLLYFFYQADEQPEGYEPQHRGSFKVLYVEHEHVSLERISHPTAPGKSTQIQAFHPCAIEFSPSITFAPEFILKLALEELAYFNQVEITLYNLLYPVHHLLGYPDPIQDGRMDLQCQLITHGLSLADHSYFDNPRHFELEPGASDWRLLLQIDTDAGDEGLGSMWGDAGRIYFWIQRQALEARRFDNCWLVLQGA